MKYLTATLVVIFALATSGCFDEEKELPVSLLNGDGTTLASTFPEGRLNMVQVHGEGDLEKVLIRLNKNGEALLANGSTSADETLKESMSKFLKGSEDKVVVCLDIPAEVSNERIMEVMSIVKDEKVSRIHNLQIKKIF